MIKRVPGKLPCFIREGGKFLIAGHKEPDGDCTGCQLALQSVLRRMGKEAAVCSAGPFKRNEVKPYAHLFVSAPDRKARDGARVILVDCSGPDRTGGLEPFLEGLPLALIDHHGTGTAAAGSGHPRGPVYVDSRAPATAVLILKLISALGMELLREEAEYLFLGLCTDTGFFRHVDAGDSEAYAAAARLVRAGANPKAAFAAINGGKSLYSRRLIGRMLTRAESFFGGKLVISTEEYEDYRRYGLEGRDSDSLYQLLQAVEGVEAVALIRQESPERCTVGLRSRGPVDVGAIAGSFGGGGHRNAAGFITDGTAGELKPVIAGAFAPFFTAPADSGV